MKRLKGMYKDGDPVDQPPETYRDGLNININDQVGSVSTERGTEVLASLPTDHELLGSHLLSDGRIITFSIHKTSGVSEIGVVEEGVYAEVLQIGTTFHRNSSFQITSRINSKVEVVVYWTDGINPPRSYNIDKDEGYTNVDELNIFNFINSPGSIKLDQVKDFGGSLTSGSYQFALRYTDEDGNTTNFMDMTPVISINRMKQKDISGLFFTQGNPTAPTGKAISLNLENLDLRFKSYQLAVIRYEGATIANVSLLPVTVIQSENQSFTYTGNEGGIDGSIEEILISNAYYDKADSLTQSDDTLYLGNLTKPNSLNLQKYVNNIKTELVVKVLDEKYSYTHGDETLTFFNRSFRREEVYAFYVSFILQTGEETYAFHIPGRGPVLNEDEVVTGGTRAADLDATAKNFHFYAKGRTKGMGYWENEGEPYPEEEDSQIVSIDENGVETIEGTLANKPVRHHRFPDIHSQPIISNSVLSGSDAIISILGVRFRDVVIPDEYKDQIKGIKFYYAKKDDNNKLVIDQAKAFREEKAEDTDLYRTFLPIAGEPSQDFTNIDTLSMIPFSTLLRDTSLARVSYIKNIGKTIIGNVTLYNNPDINTSPFDDYWRNYKAFNLQIEEKDNNDTEYISGVEAIAKTPSDVDEVQIINLGFDENKNAKKTSSEVLLKIKNPLTFPSSLLSGGRDGFLFNLMQLSKTIHNPYDQQVLVPLGETITDVENFYPETASTGVKATGSITITSLGGEDYFTFRIGGFPGATRNKIELFVLSTDTIADVVGNIANALNTSYFSDYVGVVNGSTVEIEAKETGASYDGDITILDNSAGLGTTLVDVTGGVDETARTTSPIFGGDTFINMYGIKVGTTVADAIQRTGIHFQIIESTDNIAFRQEGSSIGELNPNNTEQSENIIDLDYTEDQYFNHYIAYDLAHSSVAVQARTTPYPKNLENILTFPSRVIRGRSDDKLSFKDPFKTFLESDYLDLPKDKGEIVNLESLNNTLVVHMQRGLFRTKGREELVTNDFRAFLGSGDIFAIAPDEIIDLQEGYAGLQDVRSAVNTPFGYFFVDQQAHKVFLLAGKPNEVSERGLRNFFDDELHWYINEALSNINHRLPEARIVVGFDAQYKRLFLTKKDWKLNDAYAGANIGFNEETLKMTVNGTDVEVIDTEYFEDKSFTLSFLPEINSWVSFHSYKPYLYIRSLNDLLSVNDNTIFLHDRGKASRFYGTQYPMLFEFVDNRQASQTKLVQNVEFITYVKNNLGNVDHKVTFDKIRLMNELQDSGDIDLVYFDQANGNTRNVGHTWKVSKFRDLIDPATRELDPALPFHKKKKFTGKYIIVRLSYTPDTLDNPLLLVSATVNFRNSIR